MQRLYCLCYQPRPQYLTVHPESPSHSLTHPPPLHHCHSQWRTLYRGKKKLKKITLNPYPKTLNRELNEDDICVAPSFFVKKALPSKCDRGASKGLSAELARGSTW